MSNNEILPIPFQKQIFMDMCSAENSLLILGKGLGVEQILAAFLRLYSDKRCFVLLVNAGDELEYYASLLNSDPVSASLFRVINNEISAKDRAAMYLQGGIFAVTSRILVMDMLNEVVPIALVTGLFIHNAHSIGENSNEAFIIKMYRETNKEGFLHAFTEQPESLTVGFAKMEKLMRTLHLKKVFLWPRFEVSVAEELDKASIDLVQYRQPLSPRMAKIQQCIVALIEVCLSELKSAKSTFIDQDELTVELALQKDFDSHLMTQLDPVWHRIPFRIRQIVNDLKVLRRLLKFLLNYDCVTFHSFLHAVIASECSVNGPFGKTVSQWLFLPEADSMFKFAKERVYKSIGDKIEPVLEANPKWKLLNEILDEIRDAQSQKKSELLDQDLFETEKVIILVADSRTKKQLEQVAKLKDEEPPSGDTDVNKEEPYEQYLLRTWQNYVRFDKRLRTVLNGPQQKQQVQNSETAEPPAKKQRRRVRGGNPLTSAVSNASTKESLDAEIAKLEAFFVIPLENQVQPVQVSNNSTDQLIDIEIHPYSSNIIMDYQLLKEKKPKFVILYDPTPAIVRTLEMYQTSLTSSPLKVYFMIYENSVEEQRYLMSIKREQSAFETLIRQKGNMMVQLEQDGKSTASMKDINLVPQLNQVTRIAGGSALITETPAIVIDMREFRSQLPFLCYKKGIKIIPLTIEIGDYVLAPDICVERKSIPDLIGSMNSGRLYSQVETMCQYYKTPILLIEFDSDKAFSLRTSLDTSNTTDISQTSLTSKLILLTIHFPSLRIIWSPSPHATVEIFLDLKQRHPNPDADKVMATGGGVLERDSEILNYSAIEMLQRLPGMLPVSYRYLVRDMQNVKEVVDTSLPQLEKCLENKDKAKLLYDFLHKTV